MRYWILFLFMAISYIAKGQQEVELCPGYRNSFSYWSYSNTNTGGWLWVLNSDTVSYNNNIRITYRDTGFYVLSVIYRDVCGIKKQTYNVYVKKCPESSIFFPNAFTPNGDGINDGWSPIPFKIVQIKWQVYDRFGVRVFECSDVGKKWDGTYKGVAQPISNFVFQCWWRGVDGKTGYKIGRAHV